MSKFFFLPSTGIDIFSFYGCKGTCSQPLLYTGIGWLTDSCLPGDDQLIILDEADSMTNDAQNALRRIMEKFTENVRFCLIGNYLSKIIPALQSRSFKSGPIFCETKNWVKNVFEGFAYLEKNTISYRTVEDGKSSKHFDICTRRFRD